MFTCAHCGSSGVVRILRGSWLECVFNLVGRWPFACVRCGWAFLAAICELPAYRPLLPGHGMRDTVPSTDEAGSQDEVIHDERVASLLALWHAVMWQETRTRSQVR